MKKCKHEWDKVAINTVQENVKLLPSNAYDNVKGWHYICKLCLEHRYVKI